MWKITDFQDGLSGHDGPARHGVLQAIKKLAQGQLF
jgi:hypothetical protein